MPAMDATFKIQPPPAALIWGTMVLTPKITPIKFTSMVQRQSSADCSSMGPLEPPPPTPALFMTAWMAPNLSKAAAATRSHSLSLRASASMASTSIPCSESVASALLSISVETSVMTTFIPSRPTACATAKPMPSAPPDTTTVFPENNSISRSR